MAKAEKASKSKMKKSTRRRGKLGVAIVGCGKVAGGHARGWLKCRRPVEIRALVDVVPEHAEKLGSSHKLTKARVLTDYREVLADSEIDIVDICAYSDLHTEMIAASLEAGKHILTEKPVGYSLEECRRHRYLRRKYPKPVVAVAYSLRYYPTNVSAKKEINSGTIGRPMYASIVHNHPHRCENVFERRLGERVGSDSGGRYIAGSEMTHVTHPFDFARYVLGEADDVFCYHQKYGYFAMIRHTNGALSQVIGATAATGGQSTPYVLCVQGTKGTLFTYRVPDGRDYLAGTYRGHVIVGGRKRDFTPKNPETGHADVSRCRNFADAILKGTPLICDMLDAVRTSELLHALRDSHDHEIRVPVHHADQTG